MAKKMDEDDRNMKKQEKEKESEPKIASSENKKSISNSARSLTDELKKTLSKFSHFGDDSKPSSEQAIIRRASSPTTMVYERRPEISVVSSQRAEIIKQDEPEDSIPNREETATTEDDQHVAADESDGEENISQQRRKKMRRKLKDTKEKLISLKTKAIKSVPSFSEIKSRVRGLLSAEDVSCTDDFKSSKKREQRAFRDYKKRFPGSNSEFVSDSELVGSRKWGGKSEDCYPESETTSRMDMLFAPISRPLRPPRRSNLSNFQSVPNISKFRI